MLGSLVEVPNVLYTLGPVISAFLTDSESVQFIGRIILEIFGTSAAARLELVLCTIFNMMACYSMDLQSKTRFRVESGGFVTLPVLKLKRLRNRNGHPIRSSVQRIFRAWDQLMTFNGIRLTEEPAQPFNALQRPRARFEVPSDGREREFVGRDKSALYPLDACTSLNHEDSSRFVKSLPSSGVLALWALSQSCLEDASDAVRCLELYTVAAKTSRNEARDSAYG